MSALSELERLILGRTAPSAVKAILKAGYRKPRIITTREELASLRDGAVIRDNSGDVFQRRGGMWCGYECTPLDDAFMRKYLPATVLDEGGS